MCDLSAKDFQQTQYEFAAHLRDPDIHPAPTDIEDRRMKIYRELVYNNIESFLSSGFPILRSLIEDAPWHQLVRDFISRHQSHTPYFLEISQEFLQYLQEEYQPQESDPGFMLELAHYEWVELALDVSEQSITPSNSLDADVLKTPLAVSPLAWRLSYQYPVHRIGLEYQPSSPPDEPTFLVVYRNREHLVKFMEANAVTIRLLQLLEEQSLTGREALEQIAKELQHPNPAALLKSGAELLFKLYSLDTLIAD